MEPAATPPPNDSLLLRRFVRDGSEAAFRALAERFLPMIWSVARRVVNGDAALAEDIAQQVLADFARKAHTLPPNMPPSGWIHRHTVFTATKAVRTQTRRRSHEQAAAASEAATLQQMNTPADPWNDLAPHLDAALDRLPAADRSALLLRFYEKRGLREVGHALGISGEAARKRIDRALEKLRSRLHRRGLVPALVIFAAFLRDEAAAAPPPDTAQRILSGLMAGMESGTAAATSVRKRWGRQLLPIAGGLFVAGLVAWLLHAGAEAGAPANTGPGRRSASAPPGLHGDEAPGSAPLTLFATLMTLPEKSAGARMLSHLPGDDDAALFRDLLPQAQALQRSIDPATTLATAGHPLVTLKAIVRPKARPPKMPAQNSAPADPFAVDEPFRPGPPTLASVEAAFRYLTEWEHDPATGHLKTDAASQEWTVRNVGTSLSASAFASGPEEVPVVECAVEHNYTAPEEEIRNWWPESENQPGEQNFTQPLIRTVKLRASLSLPRSGAVVLAASQLISAEFLSSGDSEPLRVILFLNLQP